MTQRWDLAFAKHKPRHLPRHTPDALEIPTALAKVLLTFASQDPTRPHMSGLGLDDCNLCASDGVTGVRVLGVDPNGASPKDRNGWCWSREIVEAAIAGQRSLVRLAWDARSVAPARTEPGRGLSLREVPAQPYTFPPLGQAWPAKYKIASAQPVGMNPLLLSRVEDVAKVVQIERWRDRKARQRMRIALASVTGPRDPVVWEIPGADGWPTVEICVMPIAL